MRNTHDSKHTTPTARLHHTATYCKTLQHTATHCNTLQHTATCFNTLHTVARPIQLDLIANYLTSFEEGLFALFDKVYS